MILSLEVFYWDPQRELRQFLWRHCYASPYSANQSAQKGLAHSIKQTLRIFIDSNFSRITNLTKLSSKFFVAASWKKTLLHLSILNSRCAYLTLRRPICRARQFRWSRCLRASKMSQTFSQVQKSSYWLWNPTFIWKIARNYIIQTFVIQISFCRLSEIIKVISRS